MGEGGAWVPVQLTVLLFGPPVAGVAHVLALMLREG